MTFIEGIAGLIASVFAILAGMAIMVRYMAKRFDRWAEALVDNSVAMRSLTNRVFRLERALKLEDEK